MYKFVTKTDDQRGQVDAIYECVVDGGVAKRGLLRSTEQDVRPCDVAASMSRKIQAPEGQK